MSGRVFLPQISLRNLRKLDCCAKPVTTSFENRFSMMAAVIVVADSTGPVSQIKSRANPKVDAAMAVLLPGGPTPKQVYAARRTSFNATLSFAFRFFDPITAVSCRAQFRNFFATIDPGSPPRP